MADDPPDRRKFLKVATCAVGGGVGLAVGIPVLRLLADPIGKVTVTSPTEPFDLGSLDQFGAEPRKVEIIAPQVKDGWSASSNVLVGAAWIRKAADSSIVALSAVCPHLGCAVGWDPAAGNYLCPCHNSRFAPDGERQSGPVQRGMDPLAVKVVGGRLSLTWVRYKLDTVMREPA